MNSPSISTAKPYRFRDFFLTELKPLTGTTTVSSILVALTAIGLGFAALPLALLAIPLWPIVALVKALWMSRRHLVESHVALLNEIGARDAEIMRLHQEAQLDPTVERAMQYKAKGFLERLRAEFLHLKADDGDRHAYGQAFMDEWDVFLRTEALNAFGAHLYDEKYATYMTMHAGAYPEKLRSQIRGVAHAISQLLEHRDYVRPDVLLDEQRRPALLDERKSRAA